MDIRPLVEYFLDEFCTQFQIEKHLLLETMIILEKYSWPGNVRELRNIVEFLVVSTITSYISPSDLPENIKNNWDFEHPTSANTTSPEREEIQELPNHMSLKESLEQFEKEQIERAIENTKSIRSAASLLGIDHASLIRKMNRLGVTKLK